LDSSQSKVDKVHIVLSLFECTLDKVDSNPNRAKSSWVNVRPSQLGPQRVNSSHIHLGSS